MSNTSDQTIRAFEKYIFSNRNLKEALNLLPLNSEEYLYLKCIHFLNTNGYSEFKEDQEVQEALKLLQSKYGSQLQKQILLRDLFISYDQAKDDDHRKQILAKLRSYFSFYHEYQKPTNLKKIKKTENANDDETSEEEDPQMRQFESTFDSEKLFPKDIMTNSLLNNGNEANIHPRFFPVLDYSKMNNNHASRFENFVKGSTLDHIDFKNESFESELSKVISQYTQYNQASFLLNMLGVSDLIKAYMKYPILQHLNIRQSIIRKKFDKYFSREFNEIEIDDKLKALQEIQLFIESTFGQFTDLNRALTFARLALLYQKNDFDEQLFQQYVTNPHKHSSQFVDRHNKYASEWSSFISSLVPAIQNDTEINKIIEANLEHQYIALDKDIMNIYKPIFEEPFLQGLKARLDYLNNRKIDDNYYANQAVSKLTSQTYINICHYNKKNFNVNEDVSFDLSIKNVQKMLVKIFEINTDNYFRKNMKEFTPDINLDGLVAQHEQEYNFTHLPSNLQHTHTINFPQIGNRRGLFVIEMIGNGLSSRAVVQKGSLTLIKRTTIAGQFLYIIDENKKICKGDDSGVFFDNQFYATDSQTGRIVIPFNRNGRTEKAIVIHEKFSQLSHFFRQDERYNFNASFILHNESVIMGNLAKILIRPSLFLNDQQLTHLKLLENTTVTLTTINQIDNIRISKNYENIQFQSDQEYEIEFQVPSNISEIAISVATQVNVVSKGEKQKFSASHSFKVNNHSTDYEQCETYLKKENGDYKYQVRGKNGEPKKGVLVDFTFKHKYYYQASNKKLKTDKEGSINLGKLRNIQQVISQPTSSRIISSNSKGWEICPDYHFNYPSRIFILDKESVVLPFRHKQIKPTNFSLIEQSQNGNYLENRFDHAKLIINKDNHFGVNNLEIKGLKEGLYQVNLKKEDKDIMIVVFEGEFWNESEDYILQERRMIERRNNITETLRIDDVKVSGVEAEDDDGEVKTLSQYQVQLGGDFNPKNTRVHAWAYNYLQWSIKQLITDKFYQNIRQTGDTFEFPKWKNQYLQNKTMSDENRYILERKSQEKVIGNFLEKPTMLLKRNYVQDTKFNQEKLAQDGNYDRDRSMGGLCGSAGPRGAGRQLGQVKVTARDIDGYQNFLKHSALTRVNVKVNEEGVATFNMNSQLYSSVIIVATTQDQQVASVTLNAGDHQPTRNLQLLKSYDQEKSFAECRRTVNCLKLDNYVIEDITSTDMQIIDSLEKVVLIQKELSKFPSNQQDLIDNMFKWPTYDAKKRSTVYSDFCSHEFNVFLKLKDPQYFEQVVRPFLSNKIEKTFVDYWLLDLDEALQTYENFFKFNSLNAFEQCLFVQYLMRNNKVQRAQEILNSMEEKNQPLSADSMNRIYDIVLNMNSLNSKPSGESLTDMYNQMKKEAIKKKEKKDASKGKKFSAEFIAENDEDEEMEMEGEAEFMLCDDEEMKEEKEDIQIIDFSKQDKRRKRKRLTGAMLMMDDDDDYAQLAQMRQKQQPQFKELDLTKEYNETHYYLVRFRFEHKELININDYWIDLTKHLISNQGSVKGFLSSYLTITVKNFNEAALAFAFIDLPFKEESHGFKANQGRGVEIKAASNMILFLKEIQETSTNINKNLLVVHRYFEKGKMDREVEEFLINEVYCCQAIISNISNQNIKCQALVQIPEGSLPLHGSHYQKSVNHSVNAFQTVESVVYFYFPNTGVFKHFPTNVSINREVVAKSAPNTLKVKRTQSQVNQDDFDDILATESIPIILNFMRTKNIADYKTGFNFDNIYWLCKDKTFYLEAVKILREKNIYNDKFWGYSTLHLDHESMREYFSMSSQQNKQTLGSQFSSSLISNNSFEDTHEIFNFLDYTPLVNSRAHRMGGMDSSSNNNSSESKQWILNQNLRETYAKFINLLVSQTEWKAHERMMLVNYLLMQERVQEAMIEFQKIEGELQNLRGNAQIQYDYLSAYLDFYECGLKGSFEFKRAREIVQKYNNYPVNHWNKLFKEILDQLREIDEAYFNVEKKTPSEINNIEEDHKTSMKKAIMQAPQLDFVIEGKVLNIEYQNLEKVTINYYIIDLEILFSKTPFLNQDTQDFSFVQPFLVEEVFLDQSISNQKHTIPVNLQKKNLVIEVSNTAKGRKQLKTYFSADLRVRIIENYGELKVFVPNENGNDVPLPKTYVKVYQKKKNTSEVSFFKDGYTDLRGRFDYGQLSGQSIADVEQFAIFICNDEHGSLIKEAKPPSGLKN